MRKWNLNLVVWAPWILGASLVLVLADALFSPFRVLAALKSDLVEYYLPMRQFGYSELAKGHIPFWNPYVYGGEPYLGNPETAMFYPLNLPFLLLPQAQAVNGVVALHLLIAGLGTYAWARGLRLSPLACLLAGSTVMWGGPFYLHVSLGHLSNICAMAWVPLLFWMMDSWIRETRWTWVAGGAGTVALMILAGHPQTAFFSSVMGAFYAFVVTADSRQKRRCWAGFGVMALGGAALSAIQWLPSAFAASESIRGLPLSMENAKSFSLAPEDFLTWLTPFFFGPAGDLPYWGPWYFPEACLYMGVVPFFLAWFALRKRNEGNARGLAYLVLLALVLAIVPLTPVFPLLRVVVPGFDHVRGFSKFAFFVLLLGALLAGMGLDHVGESQKTQKKISRVTLVLGMALLVPGILLGLDFFGGHASFQSLILGGTAWGQGDLNRVVPERRDEFIHLSEKVEALSLFAAGSILALISFIARRKWNKTALAILGILELTLFARMNRPTFDYREYHAKSEAIRGFLRDHSGDYRVLGAFGENAQPWGRDIWGLNPFAPLRYAEWVARWEGESLDSLVSKRVAFHVYPRAFECLRLRYILTDDGTSLGIHATGLGEAPRMWFLRHWQLAPDQAEALRLTTSPVFNPMEEAVVEAEPAGFVSEPPGAVPGVGIECKDISTDRLEIRVEAPTAGLCVLGENYSSGWSIEPCPDSAPQDYRVQPVDYFLRGVFLGKGTHHFILAYHPLGFAAGRAITLAALTFLVLSWLLLVRTKEKPRNKGLGISRKFT